RRNTNHGRERGSTRAGACPSKAAAAAIVVGADRKRQTPAQARRQEKCDSAGGLRIEGATQELSGFVLSGLCARSIALIEEEVVAAALITRPGGAPARSAGILPAPIPAPAWGIGARLALRRRAPAGPVLAR